MSASPPSSTFVSEGRVALLIGSDRPSPKSHASYCVSRVNVILFPRLTSNSILIQQLTTSQTSTLVSPECQEVGWLFSSRR